MRKAGINCEVDLKNHKINYKINQIRDCKRCEMGFMDDKSMNFKEPKDTIIQGCNSYNR